MTKLINWVKDHKLTSFLLLVVFWFLLNSFSQNKSVMMTTVSQGNFGRAEVAGDSFGISAPSLPSLQTGKIAYPPSSLNAVPPTDAKVRMVTTDTSLSLKVDDVATSISRIESAANQVGGYMIDSSMSKPESAASGTISIRVPSEKRAEVLSSLRGLAVKVVSENVNGQDITDQFVDNEERLRILMSTKAKFEAILDSAKNVQDMLDVQNQLLSLQSQIDSIKGQQKYLEGSAKLTRISVYLSTDELALPYAPSNSWRPSLVFKEAVRSLVLTLRSVGSIAIWAVVYAPVAIVVGIVIMVIQKLRKRH